MPDLVVVQPLERRGAWSRRQVPHRNEPPQPPACVLQVHGVCYQATLIVWAARKQRAALVRLVHEREDGCWMFFSTVSDIFVCQHKAEKYKCFSDNDSINNSNR